MSTDRRSFLKVAAASTMAVGLDASGQTGRKPPNVLYIHSHDTGRYIQPYGHAVPTPNLQRLSQDGVLFRRAFGAAPTCSPSRAALLSGCCPHVNGMLGLAHRGFSMNDYKQHVLHTLRTLDYRSALIGTQHIAQGKRVEEIGYDLIVRVKSARGEHVAPAAVEWLRSKPRQPFFLDVGFAETHREFAPPGPAEDPRYCLPPAPIPDTPQTRRDIAGFKASARLLDHAVGEILKALEAAGLAENTLVISTTDHGLAFPAMKCNLTEHGIGVSLIMRGPGGFTGGKVCDAMISHVDLFPTICDVVGAQHPAWLQGRSMLPLIGGEKKEINDEVFAEVNYHAAYEPKRTVRTQRWQYIHNFSGRGRPVLPNCDDGLSKDLWLENDWRDLPVRAEELYDLVFDPNETRNMAGDPSYLPVLNEMRDRLDRWMRATNDPLIHGPVKAPPGAVVNDADGISPKRAPRPT